MSEDRFGGREDDLYEALVRAHAGLTDAGSAALNTRLVLLLAHAVGDVENVLALVGEARRSVSPERAPDPA